MTGARKVVVSGGFDDTHSKDIRFLQEAARLEDVTVQHWRDKAPEFVHAPAFAFAERYYILGAIRYVREVRSVVAEKLSSTGADLWVGHPQFPQNERCYSVRSIRHVWNSVISAGSGWLDADAEILAMKPDILSSTKTATNCTNATIAANLASNTMS